eukprot:3243333-Alexandrium_andersonii.AAC.1
MHGGARALVGEGCASACVSRPLSTRDSRDRMHRQGGGLRCLGRGGAEEPRAVPSWLRAWWLSGRSWRRS